MKAFLRTILLLQALLDLLVGAALLASPWAARTLDADFALPNPGISGQLAGVLLLMAGGLCWRATVDGRLTVTAARLRGHANWANAMVLLVWVFGLELQAGANGRVALVGCAALWLLYAVLELTLASRLRVPECEERAVAAQAVREMRQKARRQARQTGDATVIDMPQSSGASETGPDASTFPAAAESVVWNGANAAAGPSPIPAVPAEPEKPRSLWRKFLSFF